MKAIKKNHGHWQLSDLLRRMLMECKAEESTRYAITGIHVGKDVLVSTDGHRLVELQVKHNVPEGNYFCTSDGYLLDITGESFPKYKDIIPEKSTLRKIVETSSEGIGENIIGLILGELCHSGCVIKLSLYENPIKILSEALIGKCCVYVHKTEPKERPFIIEAETSIGDLCYVQMPINVENKD